MSPNEESCPFKRMVDKPLYLIYLSSLVKRVSVMSKNLTSGVRYLNVLAFRKVMFNIRYVISCVKH